MKPKIIFFGSDKYSQIVLKALEKDSRFQIAKSLEKKPDVGILASYGKILPPEILTIPKHGILNIHPSLLPKYRGPSPAQTAILNGEKETGVTIIKMDEKVDHGPIVAQFKEEIRPDDTAESLYKRLFAAGAEVLLTILPAYLQGKIELRHQDHSKATYTKKLTRDDGFIPPEVLIAAIDGRELQSSKATKWQRHFATLSLCNSASFLERFIRAMFPWPGAWTEVHLGSSLADDRLSEMKLKRLKILKAHLEKEKLILDQVQLEGKKPVTWKQFQEGYPEAKIIS